MSIICGKIDAVWGDSKEMSFSGEKGMEIHVKK